MKQGFFFKDTSFQVERKVLTASDLLFGEISLLESLFEKGLVEFSKCVPAISAFLGAKKLSVKIAELQYAKRLPVGGLLYFFDLKNIKFGFFENFQEEIDAVLDIGSGKNLSVHLPVGYLTISELNRVLEFLSKRSVSIMLAFDSRLSVAETSKKTLPRVLQFFDSCKVWCLFESQEHMFLNLSVMQQAGVDAVVYLG